jgi:hypothetical protein
LTAHVEIRISTTAGCEVRDVEALREHDARTLPAWVTNLEATWSAAVRPAGAGAGMAVVHGGHGDGVRAGADRVHRVLCVRARSDGTSHAADPPGVAGHGLTVSLHS